jgi:hypothetical protein
MIESKTTVAPLVFLSGAIAFAACSNSSGESQDSGMTDARSSDRHSNDAPVKDGPATDSTECEGGPPCVSLTCPPYSSACSDLEAAGLDCAYPDAGDARAWCTVAGVASFTWYATTGEPVSVTTQDGKEFTFVEGSVLGSDGVCLGGAMKKLSFCYPDLGSTTVSCSDAGLLDGGLE